MGTFIGTSVSRKEGAAKLLGQAKYIDDLAFDNMLYGVTVRSPVARGKLKSIDFQKGIPWDQFVIVTAKDIPGKNFVAFIESDQPYLVEEMINHPEEPILLLAHPDKYLVEKARSFVKLEIEELPPIFNLKDSLNKKEVIWRKDNTFKSFLINKGDVDSVWAKADIVVEGEYSTGAQEQLYIENQGVIAHFNKRKEIIVWGSLQCPYYVHKALKNLFGFTSEQVRVIQTETGGGFGGKEEYPSMIAGHAALLSYKAGKPVKMIYSRREDMAATTKRHPSVTRHKTAVDRSGKILAMEIDFTIDGGAYCTLSPVVLSRGTIHAAGPYSCANIRVKSRALATNHPPHGAFRGFGAPQSIFALERHLDEVAIQLKMSPAEFREKNFIKKGETTATEQVIHDDVDFNGLLQQAFAKTDYKNKVARFSESNKTSKIKKGIGFASFMHGAGFTGSGEKNLASVAGVEALPNGQIQILASSTEIGQGANTIFAQIAADTLGISYDCVAVTQPDTSQVPDSGPTVASRTSMIVGKLVETACQSLKQTLVAEGFLKESYSDSEFSEACKKYVEKSGPLKVLSQYQQPPGIQWDDAKYKGEAYATYAWAVYVAEVSVDTRTYEVFVDDFVAVQEAGKVLHPVLAAGQIEGGVAQGIGYALYEKVVWKDGRMANNQMTNYIIPTSMDVPPIRVFFQEQNFAHGPSGAKGIGELPLDGPAPAILNAVRNAIGIPVNHIPLLPEDLMDVMRNQ